LTARRPVGSAKLADLAADGRYALHFYQDPAVPNELQVRGRAHEILDPEVRAAAVTAWSFEPDEGYRLFDLSIEQAVLGERGSAAAARTTKRIVTGDDRDGHR
jgi:hypothetical protein